LMRINLCFSDISITLWSRPCTTNKLLHRDDLRYE
jgi:hypothetical protein